MTFVLEFLASLLDGIALITLAVVLGGIAFGLTVLRAPKAESPVVATATDRSLRAVGLMAVVVALLRGGGLLLKPLALGGPPVGEAAFATLGAFVSTRVFQAGLAGICLLGALAAAVSWLRRQPRRRGRWLVVVGIATAFMVNEAWLSHAVSRLEGGGLLMVVTVAHMLGGLVWGGAVVHLLIFRRLCRADADARALWPRLVARFAVLGIPAVALIVAPGLYLAGSYLGAWTDLIGTGYGNMVAVKIVLFGCVLALAFRNRAAGRRWRQEADAGAVFRRVPAYVEIEAILAAALLFTAAALTSFPPAADVSSDAATPAEVWTMFSPKLPRLVGPERVLIEAPEHTDLRTGQVGYKPDTRWDRFNHNVAGVIVLVLGALVLLERLAEAPWARHWPLLFVAFSGMIFVFANPDHWPLGPAGFLASLQDIEVVQHWLAALVVLGLGLFEWRARQTTLSAARLRFVFPALCIVGGIVLLTHSHATFELKREFLIQSTHVVMGLLAIGVGCGRWAELRLDAAHGRLAGAASGASMILVGLILLFYVTPDTSAPPYGGY